MQKRVIWWGSLVVTVLLLAGGMYTRFKAPGEIAPESVLQVSFWEERAGEKILSPSQQATFVNALNTGSYAGRNESLAGTTPNCGAKIQLKNGRSIALLGCGDRVEVQGKEKVAYFLDTPGYRDLFAQIMHP